MAFFPDIGHLGAVFRQELVDFTSYTLTEMSNKLYNE